jgi:hypothetical protein
MKSVQLAERVLRVSQCAAAHVGCEGSVSLHAAMHRGVRLAALQFLDQWQRHLLATSFCGRASMVVVCCWRERVGARVLLLSLAAKPLVTNSWQVQVVVWCVGV